MAGEGYIRSCVQPMSALVIFSFLFFLDCSLDSCVAGRNAAEGIEESERGYLTNPVWSMDNSSLYFAERAKDYKKIEIRMYDLLASTTSTLYAGPTTAFLTINGCNEIFTPTYKDPMNSFFIISSIGTRYYNFDELKQIIYPVWLSNCSEVVFYGCGRQDCGVFLWNKDSNALKRITPFPCETKRPDGVVVSYMYMRFAPSLVAKRIIFAYLELQDHDHKRSTTFNLGAMDLDTGKAWKITELGNIDEAWRWYSSDIEDAIYFFKWNEAGRLDSLWKVRSDGTGTSKILDGKTIGQVNSHGALVSWSKGGEKVVIKYHLDKGKRTVLVNTLTGQVNDLDLGLDPTDFALSPDGKKLAYVADSKEIDLLTIEKSAKERIFPMTKGGEKTAD